MPKLHVIQLTKGQSVLPAIHEVLMSKKWNDAVIVSGVGSVTDVCLSNPGSYEMPPKLIKKDIEAPCEVVSCMGEITLKEHTAPDLPAVIKETPSPYVVHIHMSVYHDEGIVNGGGFRSATVLRALNLYVLEQD